VQVSAPPPRRSTALRQQFAIANSTTDSGLLLFPKNLLLCKIFSGALIILGVLGAYFTRPSPPRKNKANKSCSFLLQKKNSDQKPVLPFSQKVLTILFASKIFVVVIFLLKRTQSITLLHFYKFYRAFTFSQKVLRIIF